MVSAGYCPGLSSIKLYILGDEDILNLSTVSIKTYETFVSNEIPVPGGLFDPRMGAIVNLFNCVTCGHNHHKCPGHFGSYNTGVPVLQPIAQEDVIKWLKIVCLKCGTLLIDPLKVKDKPVKQKLQFAATLQTSYKICPNCHEKHPKIKSSDDNIFFIQAIEHDGLINVMKLADIKSVLEKISDKTCNIMGISTDSHPRKYYITNVLVPPIPIRPSFKSPLTNKSHRTSPLIDFLKHIIRKSKVKGDETTNEKNAMFITRCFYDMIRGGSQKKGEVRTTNIIAGSPSDALLKTLSGKKGRIRNFLMGHRGFNGARITISGNATLRVDEVGIPNYVVRTLLISVTVREYNKNILWNYIQAGKCPRYKKVISGKEHIIDKANRSDITLEYGDVIYRHLVDGDVVNFNRQPSLKESAVGSHKAVTFDTDEQNTFQINVGACVNYGADFDGDQMLLKALTSCRSIAEAKTVTSVNRWLLSQSNAVAVNGEVQDAVVGSALLTRSIIKMDKLRAMRLFARTNIVDIIFDKEVYTGRDIISLLLKRTPINYRGRPAYYKDAYKDYIDYDPNDIAVVIEKGIVKSGILDKATIGEQISGGPFHLIALEYGTQRALDVIFQYQQIVIEYLNMRGFSMGLDNLFIKKETRETIDQIVSNKILESEAYTDRLLRDQIFPPMGISKYDYYESQQLSILSLGENVTGAIFADMAQKENDLMNMIIFGSKGKPANIIEMMGVRGSVTLEGKRMPSLFSPGRCSTYFPRFAVDPASRGFVKEPLMEGVSPNSMGYLAQSSRQMLVQKTQSTAATGANHRRHIKNMENTITNNLRQTMKSFMLIQFIYGEDGFDPRYLINQKIDTVFKNNNELVDYFKSSMSTNKDEIITIIKDRDWYRNMMYSLDRVGLQYRGFSDSIPLGIHVDSIIDHYFEDTKLTGEDLNIKYAEVKEYIDTVYYFYINETQRKKKMKVPEFIQNASRCLQITLRIKLCSNKLQYVRKSNVKVMLDNITAKLIRSLVPPGSCVGIQAGQGVGEPLTQSMLDAVHGGSAGARAGLENIKETLGSKYAAPDTNNMIIRLQQEVSKDKIRVSTIADYLKRLKLIDLYKSWQIFLEDFGEPIHPDYIHEKTWIHSFVKTHPVTKEDLSRWVIRLSLNKHLLIYKSLSVETVIEVMYNTMANIYIVYSTEEDNEVIIRIYLKESSLIREVNIETYITTVLINNILDINVRGISNILNARVIPDVLFVTKPDGSFIKQDCFMIKTVGQDLKGLLAMSANIVDDIDIDNITIGTVMDCADIYGIEAARARIVENLISKMEGKAPDYHHLALYADILTWTGDVKSIEKAIHQERNKTFARASGYSASQVLMQAALKGTVDNTSSIASPIMLGGLPKVGTGYNDFLLDEEFIQEHSTNVLDIVTKA